MLAGMLPLSWLSNKALHTTRSDQSVAQSVAHTVSRCMQQCRSIQTIEVVEIADAWWNGAVESIKIQVAVVGTCDVRASHNWSASNTTYRLVRLTKLPTLLGMLPVNWLLLRNNRVRLVNVPMTSGIGPVNSL
jgi:flavin-binding protein dodecin